MIKSGLNQKRFNFKNWALSYRAMLKSLDEQIHYGMNWKNVASIEHPWNKQFLDTFLLQNHELIMAICNSIPISLHKHCLAGFIFQFLPPEKCCLIVKMGKYSERLTLRTETNAREPTRRHGNVRKNVGCIASQG